MPTYRLDVLEPPKEGLPVEHYQHGQEFEAADEMAAIKVARKRCRLLTAFAELHRFVLFEGERVVYEFVMSARC